MKQILQQDFGYPDNFRVDEWKAQSEAIWRSVSTEIFEEEGDI